MELGIIGLGRMGANMTERLVLGGHRLISFDGYVEDSGEGRWTVEEAIERSVPVPVLMLFPFRPLYVAPGRLVLGESDRRAAQRIRRSRGEERLVARGQR
jgi:6-phosphogluconate dehydrogenase (decarboxylating)